MDAEYWQQKWTDGRIGFHQPEANKRLMRYWAELELVPACPVFVPLCGKSLDMLWLHGEGHPVLGVELSERACEAFFQENDLTCIRTVEGAFTRFDGQAAASGLSLLAGDFFDLTFDQLAEFPAFYDRASLIAMNDALRVRYAEHLCGLMSPSARGLLLTIDYDPARMEGPPFPVSDSLARSLLEPAFQMNELAHFSGPERVGNLAERGLETLDERVYRLERRSA